MSRSRNRLGGVAGALGILSLGLSAAAAAHHSFSMFDFKKTIELRGTVTEFRWANPHSGLELDVPGPSGTKHYTIEGNSTSHMLKAGWKYGVLKAGDEVVVTIHPLRNGDLGGSLAGIATLDGRLACLEGLICKSQAK